MRSRKAERTLSTASWNGNPVPTHEILLYLVAIFLKDELGMIALSPSRRFGGELPSGCDPLAEHPSVLPADCLAFSHGRGALSWLLRHRGPFASAMVAAYTCPIVPHLLLAKGLRLAAFDCTADMEAIEAISATLPGRILVVIPAMFGLNPNIDATELSNRLGDRACVLIDGAQTAFAHIDLPLPPGGGVLSGPRKCLAIGDGAILRLDGLTRIESLSLEALTPLQSLSDDKMRMRRLFATGIDQDETEALALSRTTEESWPNAPHRMTESAIAGLLSVDAATHRLRRQANRKRLMQRLDDRLHSVADGSGTPFCHSVLVPDRASLLPHLYERRLFATPLWPKSWHDPAEHPVAAVWSRELLALPVDQRYNEDDMDRLADILLTTLDRI